MIEKRLLRLSLWLRRTRPKFKAQGYWKNKKSVKRKDNWRYPDGIHNKMRKKWKGKPPLVSVGYRGPRLARGLHPSGLREALVRSVSDLESLDPNTHILRLSRTLGKRKRSMIISIAEERGFRIINK